VERLVNGGSAAMTFKKWLIVAAALFIAGIIFGLFAPADFISEEIANLEETAEGLLDLPMLAILVFILFRNIMSILVSFTLSPIFLLAPITALVLNGWILGAVSVEIAGEESLDFVLAGILPHGIIEIPAFIIAEAAALSMGATVVLALFRKERRPQVAPAFKQNLRYLIISMLLLIPAAIIETFITPIFLS
jgi:stage II sporulation protein M